MDNIVIHMEIESMDERNGYFVSDGEDIDFTANTLAEAYLYLAKSLAEKSDCYFKMGMDELQERINRLGADASVS